MLWGCCPPCLQHDSWRCPCHMQRANHRRQRHWSPALCLTQNYSPGGRKRSRNKEKEGTWVIVQPGESRRCPSVLLKKDASENQNKGGWKGKHVTEKLMLLHVPWQEPQTPEQYSEAGWNPAHNASISNCPRERCSLKAGPRYSTTMRRISHNKFKCLEASNKTNPVIKHKYLCGEIQFSCTCNMWTIASTFRPSEVNEIIFFFSKIKPYVHTIAKLGVQMQTLSRAICIIFSFAPH